MLACACQLCTIVLQLYSIILVKLATAEHRATATKTAVIRTYCFLAPYHLQLFQVHRVWYTCPRSPPSNAGSCCSTSSHNIRWTTRASVSSCSNREQESQGSSILHCKWTKNAHEGLRGVGCGEMTQKKKACMHPCVEPFSKRSS